MANSTTTRRRVCRLVAAGQSGFNCPQIEIDNGNGTIRRYLITNVDKTGQGDAYTLARRTEPGDDPLEEVRYVVWLGNSGRNMCDCWDAFYRPQRKCKHICALEALRQRGMI